MAAMAKIVVFGAGGQSARAFIQEATPRGHQVTGVVRGVGPNRTASFDAQPSQPPRLPQRVMVLL